MKTGDVRAKIRRVFRSEGGALRPGWRAALNATAYFAAFYGVLYGLAAVFGALFDAWGLTNGNLAAAPLWAQRIVYAHTDFCYAAAYLASTGIGLWITHGRTDGNSSKTKCGRWKNVLIGAGIGLGIGGGITLLAFALDSMRMEWPIGEPRLNGNALVALGVIAIGRISHEALCRRLIYAPLKASGRALAIVISSATTAVLIGEWSVCGVLSGLLLGAVCCALYDRGGLLAGAAMQTAWTAWCTLLFGFPGMNANAVPVWRLYHVSDAWLTGGNGSALGGAWCALLLAIACAALYRREIQPGARKLKALHSRRGGGTK